MQLPGTGFSQGPLNTTFGVTSTAQGGITAQPTQLLGAPVSSSFGTLGGPGFGPNPLGTAGPGGDLGFGAPNIHQANINTGVGNTGRLR